MFTGIITDIGTVAATDDSGGKSFSLRTAYDTATIAIGASIACDGCCLTVVEKGADTFTVQVSRETLACTTLGEWKPGRRVNLERALRAGDELGGHMVLGHVDAQAVIEILETAGESRILWLSLIPSSRGLTAGSREGAPDPAVKPRDDGVGGGLIRLIAPKGSVTLDGVSLTVNEVKGGHFSVNIIPHTLGATTLGRKKAGDRLNLEIDVIARYVARLHEK